ncbi:LysR family transcriptional regulator [Streptomyces olivaceoviridis]|nr:LysR family transcriptional regulator [Streptomyces corchorusii]
MQGLYLVVRDLEAARAEPAEHGVHVGEIRHKAPLDTWQGCFEPGVDPERRDYASFAEFSDLTATCGRRRSAVFVPREVGAASSGLLASLTFRSFPLSDPAVRTGAFAADHQESCMATSRALECLVAWVDEGSVTKAAGVLHMSQPALSHQIAALEKELGTPVVERLSRGIRVTAAGRAVAEEARVALAGASRRR